MAKGTRFPIVPVMVNCAGMAGGGESKWTENKGSRKCIKPPPAFQGVTQSGFSFILYVAEYELWRAANGSEHGLTRHVICV